MLRLLGKPHVALQGDVVTGLPDKAYVLLALLVLQGGGVMSRDRLRTMLWEDATAEGAGESLRWLLSRARKWESQHDYPLLASDRKTVKLAAGVTSDVAALAAIESIQDAADLERLLDLYRGELLTDVDFGLGAQLLETIRGHRAAIRRKYVALAQDAAERIGGERGERILRDLLAAAPDDEGVMRALLVHLARERGPRAVTSEYEAFVARLRTEFDVAPSVETVALYAQLVPARAKHAEGVPSTEPSDSGLPRIVLLPPTTPLAADAQAAAIAAALVEDVCLQLCRMRTFAMFAPHTARQVAGLDPVAAVAPFGVNYVASTRLLPAARGGLRLSLSLVRTATNSIVLAEQFEYDEASLAAHFAELAESIASQLAGAVERVELADYRRTGAASAYVQYLLGSKVLDNNDLASLRRARRHFARALELEPNYVPALTGIARTLSKESLALRRADAELPQRAMRFADKAAEIDPLDPSAWREKAMASLYLHAIDASIDYLDAALTRAPHQADIMAEKADVLVHASRPTEAKELVLRAMNLNPIAPDDYYWTLGAAEFFLGRYEQAVAALLRMRKVDTVSRLVAAAAAMAGDIETANRFRERWLSIYPQSRVDDVGRFMPHASKADVEHFCAALRRAGFP